MTIKDELHLLVDRLDDERAMTLLTIAARIEQSESDEIIRGTEAGIDVDRDTLFLLTRPVSEGDSFWSAPPLDEEEGPTDMATNKYKYLAEAYGDLHDK